MKALVNFFRNWKKKFTEQVATTMRQTMYGTERFWPSTVNLKVVEPIEYDRLMKEIEAFEKSFKKPNV